MKKTLTVAATIVALILTTAGGCPDKTPDKAPKKPLSDFDANCRARGGTPQTVRKGHSITRVCYPPPGGWN